jgi:hypothetical protein
MNAPIQRCAAVCALTAFLTVLSAVAGGLAPSQVYYVPFPEDNQLAGFVGVNSAAVDPLAVFVTFSASADNTVIYYDHWEDGYEDDITRPKQSTTQVLGDADYRDSSSSYVTDTVSVPAGGNARVNLSPSDDSTNFGAYHFYTTGGSPESFYALCGVDAANPSTSGNQAYDGGFTLVGQPSLTTQVLLSLGIGRDPYSSTNPAENGNPVWITTVGNGHSQETVYVDFNGDNAGAFTDLNGNHYDVSYDLRELEQKKIFDPDGDQGGMLVYVLNPDVKVAAAWAQDPTAAQTGQPGLDVATLIPPLREGDAAKGSSVAIDADGDGSHR